MLSDGVGMSLCQAAFKIDRSSEVVRVIVSSFWYQTAKRVTSTIHFGCPHSPCYVFFGHCAPILYFFLFYWSKSEISFFRDKIQAIFLAPTEDRNCNSGGQWTYCVMIKSLRPPDPLAPPREPPGGTDGTSCRLMRRTVLAAAVYYSRASPGIRLMVNIKAASGILEQWGCGWRSSPMNSATYMGQTPSAHLTRLPHYQFMEPLNVPCLSSDSHFFLPCL